MKKLNLRPAIPYLSAVAIFFVLSMAYFIKPLSEGKKLHMGDISNFRGMVQEVRQFEKETGEKTLWTNSMFSGMPTYLMSSPKPPKILRAIQTITNLNNFRPVSFIFLYLTGFYIALLLFGVNKWLSIVGAIAYAFSTYFLIIIEAGHASKVITLGHMPVIIAGVYYALRKNALVGSAVMAVFLALQILTNHLQITYYTLLIVLIYGIFELVRVISEKTLNDFLRRVAFLVVGAGLAVLSNATVLWTTLEYGKYSIRGKSELSHDEDNQTSGLDLDYATGWSYGIDETLSLLIPNIKGGASGGALKENSETYELFKRAQGASYAKKVIKQLPLYWGKQPFTSGPVYVGAAVILLFVMGLFLLPRQKVRWLVVATIVSILLSWGNNIMWLTEFLMHYLPGYNKFRTVSMALVMAQFTIPLVGIMAVAEIMQGNVSKEKLMKALKNSVYIVGGVCLVFAVMPGAFFNFEGISDQQYITQGNTQFIEAIRADRESILRADAFRSLIFTLAAAAVVYLFHLKKLNMRNTIVLLAVVILVDLWPVNKRYLNDDNFVSKRDEQVPFKKTQADAFILQDTDPNFRVLNITKDPFRDASTSYYHKSIGGYHGAKMRRYQELIDFHIANEMTTMISKLQNRSTPAQALANANVLNMLNTKYIIYSNENQPMLNPNRLGNAWLANSYKIVKNADEEIAALGNTALDSVAVIDKRFAAAVAGYTPATDSTATIRLNQYKPNYLSYAFKATKPQLAIFSEVYYPKGWIAKIDGQVVDYFRADYILRALVVPEGEHTIEFSFEPQSYKKGRQIASVSSILLLLAIAGSVYISLTKARKQ